MKTLKLNQMEVVEGGSRLGCGAAMLGYAAGFIGLGLASGGLGWGVAIVGFGSGMWGLFDNC